MTNETETTHPLGPYVGGLAAQASQVPWASRFTPNGTPGWSFMAREADVELAALAVNLVAPPDGLAARTVQALVGLSEDAHRYGRHVVKRPADCLVDTCALRREWERLGHE